MPFTVGENAALSVGAPGSGGGTTTIELLEKRSYLAFFRQANAEEQLQRDNWKLFRAWTRNAADTDRYIKNLSRPGTLTAGLN